MEPEPGMLFQPFEDLLAVMHRYIICDNVNSFYCRANRLFKILKKLYAFCLTFTVITLSVDTAGAGIKGSKQL